LPLALCAHATSKLAQASDLEHIGSLGFRGEALASMGAVARVKIVSRPRGELHGASIECQGGTLSGVRAEGAPEGTQVEVRDLFFHTPARRRFLKSPAAELGRALDVLQRLALASPGVGFSVRHDGRRLLDLEAELDLAGRVRRLFGAELCDALVALEAADGSTRIAGYVAPPRFARADAARQMWFLNGRPVRDKVLLRCLKDAYRGYLFEGRQPVAFLALAMDPAGVDVNVHPAKTEVRVRDEKRLFSFLVTVLRQAVSKTDMSAQGSQLLGMAQRREARERGAGASAGGAQGVQPALAYPGARERAGSVKDHWLRPAPPAAARAAQMPADLPLGECLQVAKTYIVRARPDGFEVIDQHALHERVTFEALKRDFQAGQIEVQRALVPELVEVAPDEAERLEEHLEGLAKIGVHLTRFGPATFTVGGLPARLARPRPAAIVREILDAIAQRDRAPGSLELLEEVLHRAACRSSVMAGDELSQAEMRALLERGRALESDQTCVHGRPTRVRFTLAELERAFLRKA
jgi:DNA mismatch repair protein MutL